MKSTLLTLLAMFAVVEPLSAQSAPATSSQPPATTPAPLNAATPANPVVSEPRLFTDQERTAIVAYWNAPGRYRITLPPDAVNTGPYCVRLTPEGSQWFLTYQRTVAGKAKLPPTQDAKPALTGPYGEWEAWVSARLAYDRAVAEQAAAAMNTALTARNTPATPRPLIASRNAPRTRTTKTAQTQDIATAPATAALQPSLPAAPGPIPASLLAACGNPPAFASVVVPLQYEVRFDTPEESFSYMDNVRLRERYAYYRFPRGVVSYGQRLKDIPAMERDLLFRAAGFTPAEQRIFCAVSKLEGGFETVQTYDTGFVSIGFIQFVTLAEGKHDLSSVLLTMKQAAPEEYEKDFRRFGIDVRPDMTLTVIDPATGAEIAGNAAVLKIIDDKRLTAVFQRAGRRTPFRVAQIKVARSYYWPTDDRLAVTLPDGTVITGTVGDCVRSEAGLACLLDRKINTGNIRLLADVCTRVAVARNCRTMTDLSKYEQEIVAAMRYRDNFLADATLGQPPAPPVVIPVATPTPVVVAKKPEPKKETKASKNGGAKEPKGTVIPAPPPTVEPALPSTPVPTPTPTPTPTPVPTPTPAPETPSASGGSNP